MRVTYENPKMKHSERTNQLGYSTSTLQRYRNDMNMLSPYIIHQNNTNKLRKKTSNTNFDNNSHHNLNIKRPEMISNDLKRPQSTSNENSKKVKTKNNLKVGFVQDNNEIDENYLDEILQNNNT